MREELIAATVAYHRATMQRRSGTYNPRAPTTHATHHQPSISLSHALFVSPVLSAPQALGSFRSSPPARNGGQSPVLWRGRHEGVPGAGPAPGGRGVGARRADRVVREQVRQVRVDERQGVSGGQDGAVGGRGLGRDDFAQGQGRQGPFAEVRAAVGRDGGGGGVRRRVREGEGEGREPAVRAAAHPDRLHLRELEDLPVKGAGRRVLLDGGHVDGGAGFSHTGWMWMCMCMCMCMWRTLWRALRSVDR